MVVGLFLKSLAVKVLLSLREHSVIWGDRFALSCSHACCIIIVSTNSACGMRKGWS